MRETGVGRSGVSRWTSTSHPAIAKKMMNADLTDGSLGSRYISSVFLLSVLQRYGSWLEKADNEINKIGGAHC